MLCLLVMTCGWPHSGSMVTTPHVPHSDYHKLDALPVAYTRSSQKTIASVLLSQGKLILLWSVWWQVQAARGRTNCNSWLPQLWVSNFVEQRGREKTDFFQIDRSSIFCWCSLSNLSLCSSYWSDLAPTCRHRQCKVHRSCKMTTLVLW